MMFIRRITNHIYSCQYDINEEDIFTAVIDQWNDVEYLYNFFTKFQSDLEYFNVVSVNDAVRDTLEDAEYLETLFLRSNEKTDFDKKFKHLDNQDFRELLLEKSKVKRINRPRHDSWLRLYAIRVDKNLYLITGGTIKLTHDNRDRKHTQDELVKLEKCRNYLKENGVYDELSFDESINTNNE